MNRKEYYKAFLKKATQQKEAGPLWNATLNTLSRNKGRIGRLLTGNLRGGTRKGVMGAVNRVGKWSLPTLGIGSGVAGATHLGRDLAGGSNFDTEDSVSQVSGLIDKIPNNPRLLTWPLKAMNSLGGLGAGIADKITGDADTARPQTRAGLEKVKGSNLSKHKLLDGLLTGGAIAGAGYGGYKLYKYLKDKRKDDEEEKLNKNAGMRWDWVKSMFGAELPPVGVLSEDDWNKWHKHISKHKAKQFEVRDRRAARELVEARTRAANRPSPSTTINIVTPEGTGGGLMAKLKGLSGKSKLGLGAAGLGALGLGGSSKHKTK